MTRGSHACSLLMLSVLAAASVAAQTDRESALAALDAKRDAYAKVALNVVDVDTSQIVTSVQGAGEYELSSREVVGFGGAAGYDATLNGKVLNLAIMEAVNNLVTALERGDWRPSSAS